MNSQVFPWLLIAASVVAEVAGTIALRFADGFTRFFPSVAVCLLYGVAIWLMSLAVKHLELGLTYAVWAGSGTALTALVGILYFNESAHTVRLPGFALIVAGVVILNISARQVVNALRVSAYRAVNFHALYFRDSTPGTKSSFFRADGASTSRTATIALTKIIRRPTISFAAGSRCWASPNAAAKIVSTEIS